MGLSSLLQQIEKRGKPITQHPQKQNEDSKSSTFQQSKGNISSKNRPVDPVVARLKEKRRLEKERTENSKTKHNGTKEDSLHSKKPQSSSMKASRSLESKSGSRPKSNIPNDPNPSSKTIKQKLTFNELMKRASSIDHEKLSIKYPKKSKSPESVKPKNQASQASDSHSTSTKADAPNNTVKNHSSPATSRDKKKPPSLDPKKKLVSSNPIPSRQPNAKLQAKISLNKSKKTNQIKKPNVDGYDEEEDDSEMDDFLASDDEVINNDDGYDREQIWAMFNKGKKRSYHPYDDYSDEDMEATGADILEEEFKSKLDAEREDRKEAEAEKRRALEKLKRKKIKQ
ncbi:uncharacterized protein KGF55_004208 [Candida pseudojiufengensis]|uniref:uncharacterized protein n=1 Tax=Candida pseudojiufengensis TaxID=497109 RepID=UPI002225B1E3|nr:uncharacterized protein KGF55_004208 [Candida pseudojiufengensis]KAI5960941.1 hypothetical protein KGF55_004208 [Candida pseudojiufengensis]